MEGADGSGKIKRMRVEGARDPEGSAEDLATKAGSEAQGPTVADFTKLELKPDHEQRPMWVCPNGQIILETYSPLYKHAYDFLIAVAEPVCRPENIHEYTLTPHSLYAAVSVGLDTDTIIGVLGRLSKTRLAPEVVDFIRLSTQNYGKIKLVLKESRYFVESQYPEVLRELLNDDGIRRARILGPQDTDGDAFFRTRAAPGAPDSSGVVADEIRGLTSDGDDAVAGGGEDLDTETHSFEIDPHQVENVKQRCLPTALNYPMLEEYDFRNDHSNPDLNVEMKPIAKLRPYQEKSLSKMFGNGRARSGIIVLPCGAGKSLVGVSAAVRVGKSCLCLATNAVSVTQWRYQFLTWSNIKEEQICKFTADTKELFTTPAGVLVTTFHMIAQTGKRSEESQRVMEAIESREWGLLLMDEVHVVPAHMFRRVIKVTKSHCKLGLTATLVREDDKIQDLHFLIGPKLYEANWLDLVRGGFIANVQCVEVWCPMTKEFYAEYLKADAQRRRGLYWMNPNKFRACEYLIRFHERERKDKIIVFSDDTFALEHYARKLSKPMIYGATSNAERERVIHAFRNNPAVNTIFLSRVGDTSIDIPEANVIIQISSQAGSRRQEAQRLGRILRAKGTLEDRMSGGAEEYNAFFYSLVSTDTQEMFFSARRQQFLVNQGYSFKVVTNLPPEGEGQDLAYSKLEDQLDLLSRVLSAGEGAFKDDFLAEDQEELPGGPMAGVRRTAGSLSGMSGAQGGSYLEYRRGPAGGPGGAGGGGGGRGGAGRGGGAGGGGGRGDKPKAPTKQHKIFKKLGR